MQSAFGRNRPLGERLTGCPSCNRWQDATGKCCRLAPDDIIALTALKATKTWAGQSEKDVGVPKVLCSVSGIWGGNEGVPLDEEAQRRCR